MFLVKRVEAIPGDIIEGKSGTIFLNGKELDEGFEKPNDPADSFLANFGPVKVHSGEYFVLGDNRPVSLDSRAPLYGPVKESEISGRALFVFNPLDHLHDKRLVSDAAE
jgi:signal peptidase I